MAEGHTFGPTCAYYESDAEDSENDGLTPPKVKAQFFYISSLPIDDPLSPLPPIQADRTTDQPPQPFSIRDTAALEEAWQGSQNVLGDLKTRPSSRGLHRMVSFPKFKSSQVPTPEVTSPITEVSNYLPGGWSQMKVAENLSSSVPKTVRKPSSRSQSPVMSRKPSERGTSIRSTPHPAAEAQVMLNQELENRNTTAKSLVSKDLGLTDALHDNPKRNKHRSPFRSRTKDDKRDREISPEAGESSNQVNRIGDPELNFGMIQSDPESDLNISGNPFARAPSWSKMYRNSKDQSPESAIRKASKIEEIFHNQQTNSDEPKMFVPVGVSRLHLVEFPDLMMKPIYWSPINDTSAVVRATWFYKDSMLPVPADIANLLERGYEDMKPFSPSYQDELNACAENGAAAELKIVHKLWPDEKKSSRPSTAAAVDKQDADGQETMSEGLLPEEWENVAVDPRVTGKRRKLFETYSVIYIDAKQAQILRPSALPSVSRNRKPLSSIRKGRQLGIAVTRGFDRNAWLKLHPDPKMSEKAAHAKVGAYMSQSGDAATRQHRMSCHICDEQAKKPRVTDLVLVVHGIGQKMSERVDSYHFTHAINGLRREFNVQLSLNNVKGSLKEDAGIMVLPVNWRLTVSFDEDLKRAEVSTEDQYHLKDITPETLPAIRSLISEVILDIPYYMSHHKQKMVAAVVREANRVYRLWCRNNPGFQDYGRVHLIAHSLGSAMTMDILSQQPTKLSKDLELTEGQPSDTIFEFDTTNLFNCGSPSGFFLLLNGANLVPRKGRNKPGMEGEDHGHGIAGEAEQYGCLAVDNVYNILHKNDPIAYQQNACVDSNYASLLLPATIPSATQSLFGRLSGSLRFSRAATSPDAYGYIEPPQRPSITQMPSTVELETHNFTREEIAEKRMYLLNENGQIDYFLQSGGGPLEIQYLNMLSAHSSYWILQDFVRFLVVEIGRKPGKENTLPVLRAVKKRIFKKGDVN